MEKGAVIRIFVVIILAIAVAVLFFKDEIKAPKLEESTTSRQSYTLAEVDSTIEKVLEKFQIDKSWVKRTEIAIEGASQKRIERKIAIPPDIIPALLNVALKRATDEYGLQVSAAENLKENIVTVHIRENKKIIESIVLKITKLQKKEERKEKSYQHRKT